VIFIKIFFSADFHFGHSNIIAYTNRPFSEEGDYFINEKGDVIWKTEEIKDRDTKWMNETIIKRYNSVVGVDDLLYHVGDFAFKGVGRHFEKILNGDIVHIQGNHDSNNGTKTYIRKCMMYFGGKDVFVQHHPPKTIEEIPICDFVVCGHVHNKWKHKFLDGCDTPIINVGVDVWGFEPVSTLSLLKYYSLVKNNLVDTMGNRKDRRG